jgi:NAD-dependent SIR2 family protein deacetylase
MYQDFVRNPQARQRYWARSLVGWPRFAAAQPNAAHRALAALETIGHVRLLVTQNVDGLHQKAGSRRVLDLHGRLDRVQCLDCAARFPRETFQLELAALNPDYAAPVAATKPDGDAQLGHQDVAAFRVPTCRDCGGTLKPAVVFFGENVPPATVSEAHARLAACDALLVVGSSLMVYSGYRFVRAARDNGKPIAAINLGRTRADDEFSVKLDAACGEVLPRLLAALTRSAAPV